MRLIQSYRFIIFMENIFMDSEAGFMIIFKKKVRKCINVNSKEYLRKFL